MNYNQGSQADLLIDTGVGIHSLPNYLRTSGLRSDQEKPLEIVLTHCHFDHSGGSHHWPQIRVHQSEGEVISTGDKFMTASWISGHEVTPKPANWRPEDYCVQPHVNVQGLDEGHVFELGDRRLKVLHIPGHSPGSIALHDQNNGVLVTGDTLYQTDHGLIDWYPGSDGKLMEKSVSRLLELIKTEDVGVVLPGHNDVIDGVTAAKFGEMYLEQNTSARRFKKMFSRNRARAVLKANTYFTLPQFCKEIIAN